MVLTTNGLGAFSSSSSSIGLPSSSSFTGFGLLRSVISQRE